jgi:hypothetical protein
MKNLITAGVASQPFGSWPVFYQSNDGVNWDAPVSIFTQGDSCTGITSDGTTLATANSTGTIGTSTDLIHFSYVTIDSGLGISSLGYDARGYWIAAGTRRYIDGYGPYEPGSSVPQVYLATSATNPWSMVFTHPDNNATCNQMKYFASAAISTQQTADVWVMCGSSDNHGDIWYSLDYGISWAQGTVPVGVGTLYSVGFIHSDGSPYWYFGSNGKIWKTDSLHSNQWEEILLLPTETAVDMIQNAENTIVIAAQDSVYSSKNGIQFKRFTAAGYVFDRVSYVQSSRWVAFARSTLTQYTQWTSTDLITWTPSTNNNSVHVQASHSLG